MPTINRKRLRSLFEVRSRSESEADDLQADSADAGATPHDMARLAFHTGHHVDARDLPGGVEVDLALHDTVDLGDLYFSPVGQTGPDRRLEAVITRIV